MTSLKEHAAKREQIDRALENLESAYSPGRVLASGYQAQEAHRATYNYVTNAVREHWDAVMATARAAAQHDRDECTTAILETVRGELTDGAEVAAPSAHDDD